MTWKKLPLVGSQLRLWHLGGNLNTSASAFTLQWWSLPSTSLHTISRHRGSRESMKAMYTNRIHSFLAETTGVWRAVPFYFRRCWTSGLTWTIHKQWTTNTAKCITMGTRLAWCHYLKTRDVWGKKLAVSENWTQGFSLESSATQSQLLNKMHFGLGCTGVNERWKKYQVASLMGNTCPTFIVSFIDNLCSLLW